MTSMHRFTAYCRELSANGHHDANTANPDNEPQFEGVVFSDGTCVIKWRTKAQSTSVFASLREMLAVHGHPEYGTDIVWHDLPAPPEHWAKQCYIAAASLAKQWREVGSDVRVIVEHTDDGQVTAIGLRSHTLNIERFLMPYTPLRRITVDTLDETPREDTVVVNGEPEA